ncbi:MAG TPA: hypothetical protein VIQ30_05505 [Pseudonocardia sp.]
MATFALTNEYLTINAVNLSDHVRAATLSAEADQLDSTAMGDSWREYTGGLKQGTLTVEFLDDFAASSVDETIWNAFNTGTAVATAVRPVNTTIATTNPEYQQNILPNQWSLGGSLGEMAGKSLTFPLTGAITRDTTP